MWEGRRDDKLNTKVGKWSQPTGDDLREIIRDVQTHHILDNKKDRHYVSLESLAVLQLCLSRYLLPPLAWNQNVKLTCHGLKKEH
uniref:Uncharacterized protein n=1 Tax=Magallana gigas TaxID=29159 RepID=A0A8W8P218_MAGGI